MQKKGKQNNHSFFGNLEISRFHLSDLKICVFDAKDFLHKLEDSLTLELIDKDTIVIFNKADQLDPISSLTALLNSFPSSVQSQLKATAAQVLVSCIQGHGITEMITILEGEIKKRFEVVNTDVPLITRARHRELLIMCLESLLTVQSKD